MEYVLGEVDGSLRTRLGHSDQPDAKLRQTWSSGRVIEQPWIDAWSKKYDIPYDSNLKGLGDRVRQRRHYDRDDLLEIGHWKSARATGRMSRNTDDEIQEITGLALSASEPLRHRILTLLKGVGVPMASALLMAWDPEKYTVIDVRAVSSLVAHGEISPTEGKLPPYLEYLQVCREIAQRCDRDLRTVDRALYAAAGATKLPG